MLSSLKRNYLIVSSDSLLIMCQSINIITPKRKLEVIQTNTFNRKRCLTSYHFMHAYACICLHLDITTAQKLWGVQEVDSYTECDGTSYGLDQALSQRCNSISQFCWTETNKSPLKGKEYIYKIHLSGLSSIPDFSGRQMKVIFEII